MSDLPDGSNILIKIDWLGEKGVGAEIIGLVYIRAIIGVREDNDREGAPRWMSPDPAEDLETINARHLDIQKEQSRERTGVAIRVFTKALKIIDGFFTIGDYDEGKVVTGAGKSSFNQVDIVGIVVS